MIRHCFFLLFYFATFYFTLSFIFIFFFFFTFIRCLLLVSYHIYLSIWSICIYIFWLYFLPYSFCFPCSLEPPQAIYLPMFCVYTQRNRNSNSLLYIHIQKIQSHIRSSFFQILRGLCMNISLYKINKESEQERGMKDMEIQKTKYETQPSAAAAKSLARWHFQTIHSYNIFRNRLH